MLRKLLDRPIMVSMMLFTVVVLGLVSVRLLPVSLIPDVDIPYVTVQINAPSLSAREIDASVISILRQHLIQMSDLDDLKAEARDGSGVVWLTFRQGSKIDYNFIEVNEKIDQFMAVFGHSIDRPRVFKTSAADIPAFYINMTLKEDRPADHERTAFQNELYPVSDKFDKMCRFAEDVVARRLEQLEEVAMVDMSGCTRNEILVIPDNLALMRMGMTEREFESVVSSANVRLGNLTIRDGEYSYNVKFQSFAATREDIADIYLNRNGKIFQLRDIAQVVEHPAARTGLVRANGKDAVTIAVIKQSSARMSDLRNGIGAMLSTFKDDYPEIDFEVTRDQTELLDYSIGNLIRNIIVGILLAFLVIFLFMQDFRSPALVAITMPVALLFTILVFHIIGLSINIISLSGLLLGVGMMVDNTIVLIDNITARWQRGEYLVDAVVKGTSEVMAAMLSSVLTTVAVFVPLLFMSGVAGAMFHDEALAITIVLITSYIVTIVVVPVYYYLWYRNIGEFRPSPVLHGLDFGGVMKIYEGGLNWMFGHRWLALALFVFSVPLAVLCLVFMPKEKLPEITYADALLRVEWNSPISLERNESRVSRIESLIESRTESVTSMVGVQEFVLGHSGENSPSEALIYFKCRNARDLPGVKSDIESFLLNEYPEAVGIFSNSGNIFETVFANREAPLVARLRTTGGRKLVPAEVRERVSAIQSVVTDANISEVVTKRDILYVADPEKMALYDISCQELLDVLKNAMNGNRIFEIMQGNSSVPVVMGVNVPDASTLVSRLSVQKHDVEIPLQEILRQTYDEDLKTLVSGADGSYYPIEIDIDGSDVPSAMNAIRKTVSEDGYFDVSFSGSWFSNKKMVMELLMVLIVAVLLLYLILASQFESLLQPVIVLSEIVIDIGLSLAFLWICGISINMMSLIGLVVICGIVINDSILKIDTINKLRSDGFGLESAIHEAGRRRLKAIIMTSLTTILAVCPFLSRASMGSDLQFPMSMVIIAGMTVGTLVSIYVVPIAYYVIYKEK